MVNPNKMITPRLPSLFKKTSYKSFDYQPLYYDEQKERIEQLNNNIQKDSKQGVSRRIKFQSVKSKNYFYANIRLVAIVFGLLVLAYYILIF